MPRMAGAGGAAYATNKNVENLVLEAVEAVLKAHLA